MGNSIRIFTVRGIDIRMHFTFPLILVWGAIQFALLGDDVVPGAIFGILVTLLLFAIVVLHELGHSFAAQYFGVDVEQIVLWPIGGVAQLAEIPDKPNQEFVIAIAGPLVNFVLAILFWIVALLFGLEIQLGNLAELLSGSDILTFGAIFNYLFYTNLFLGLFNLLPAFPMDGGRILRALLATRLSYVRATQIATRIGQYMAWLLGLWGFLGGGFFMILIAIFVYLGAGQEGQMVEVRNVLKGLTVRQAYSRQALTLGPNATLQEAIDLTLSSFQSDFSICEENRLVGLLTYPRLLEALKQDGPESPVSRTMLTNIKPAAPDDEIFEVQQRMTTENLSALPVALDGNYLGMLTNRDISELYTLVSSQPGIVIPAERG